MSVALMTWLCATVWGQVQNPLPGTSRGCLVVPYDHLEYALNDQGKPDSVTFVIGEGVETIGGKKQLLWYTFPYCSCRHDTRLPFSTFLVKGRTVYTSWDLSVDRSPVGGL